MQAMGGDEWWEDDCPVPDVPPVDLPDDPDPEPVDALDEIVRSERAHNTMEGHRARWILDLLTSTTTVGAISPRDLVAAEIGAALRLGSGAALKLVDISVALHDRLPATLRAVCAGDVSWYKATILAELTAPLTGEQARVVEDTVLAKAAQRTPAQHRDAVRRAVARIDPQGADTRRKRQQQTIRLIRTHYDDGMGDLFARMPSEQLDTIWSACDFWARSRKAQGDPRTLDQLRVAALVQWAQSFLHHGDPTYCDRWCEPGSHGGPVPNSTGDDRGDDGEAGPGDNDPDDESDGGAPTNGTATVLEPVDDERSHSEASVDPEQPTVGDDERADNEPSDEVAPVADEPPASVPPTRHGRPAALHAFWDLTSLLGLTRHCGELTDSGAMLPPGAMAELVAGGVAIRRMLIDPASGHLVDLTPRTWRLPRTKTTELDAPVVLGVTLDTDLWQAIRDGSADPALLAAIATAPEAVRDMLAHPITADGLDTTPSAYPAPARLAEFVAM